MIFFLLQKYIFHIIKVAYRSLVENILKIYYLDSFLAISLIYSRGIYLVAAYKKGNVYGVQFYFISGTKINKNYIGHSF